MLALRFCCPRPGHRFLDHPLGCRYDADSRIRRTCGLGPCHPGCRGRHRGCDLHGPRAEGDPGRARTHSRGYLARVVGRTLVLAMEVGLGWVLVVSTPTSVLTSVAVGTAFGAAMFLPWVWRLEHGPRVAAIGLALSIALPSYLGNLAQVLNYRLDLYFVRYFRDLREVGLYALAATLAQFVWLGSKAMALVVFPRVAAADEEREAAASRTAQLSRITLWTGVGGAILLPAALCPALPAIYGAEFKSAWFAAVLLLPGVAVFGTTNVLAAHLVGIGRPRLNLLVATIALMLTVVLDLTWCRRSVCMALRSPTQSPTRLARC